MFLREHVAQIGNAVLDQGQIACADDISAGIFHHRQLEPGTRTLALRLDQTLQIVGAAVLIAGTEK
jgi:hypothetical protein